MNLNIKSLYIILFILIFVILPSIFFIFVDIPKRAVLKDVISLVTVLSFFIVIGQFYLSRINKSLKDVFKAIQILKVHKIIGYIVLPILLFHPFFIVVPRYFEVGVKPLDSFIVMITSFDSLGIILGLVAWVLMLLLGLTSMLKDKLTMSYTSWKIFHGILSLAFIFFASWHAIDLGRHMSLSMNILLILIALIASILLLKSYFFTKKKTIIKAKENHNE